MNNLYSELGIDKSSTKEAIKKAYRRKAKKIHPDINKSTGDEFNRISIAYKVLSNDESRKCYDETGQINNSMDTTFSDCIHRINSILDSILQSGQIGNYNWIDHIKVSFTEGKERVKHDKNNAINELSKLTEIKNSIEYNASEPNILIILLDEKLNNINKNLIMMDKELIIIDKCIDIMKNYSLKHVKHKFNKL